MAAVAFSGVQYVGTEASPIALGATGGASDVWTWAHNKGSKALKIEILLAASRQEIASASVVATQPSVNSIVLTNTSGGALSCIARIVWEDLSESVIQPLAASVGVLS